MLTLHLNSGREARIRGGHPWVYRTEIARVEGEAAPGAIGTVRDHRGRLLGQAMVNLHSQIVARMLTRSDEAIDRAFFARRIRRALSRPGRSSAGPDACRLIFGEGDHLPGLIVDRFADLLVLQFLTAGMDRQRETLVPLLAETIPVRAIFERSDTSSRRLEGLEPRTGFLLGGGETGVWIDEGGVAFYVEAAEGQKTGFFLDQRENRRVVRELAKARRVLDCFCYAGGFAVSAAAGGAAAVLGIDLSSQALGWAERAASRNGLSDRCTFLAANVFDQLRALEQAGRQFDLVVLDPPAFTKGRQAIAGALRGYKEINLRAMRLLPPGGRLLTCSCSYHVDPAAFLEMLRAAAADVHREFLVLEQRTQAPDHPILLGTKETQYLKCVVLEAVE
ncbi:MAG: class I SAM-dependent rRNA methyltransferase [Candidatus Methylomirabilota bacterium]